MNLLKITKALSDETRIRILNLLRNTELCVCEIQYTLKLNQSTVSRCLAKLSEADLVISSKKAQWVSYKINGKILVEHPFVKQILDEELEKIEQCKEDLRKLGICQQEGIPCERGIKLD